MKTYEYKLLNKRCDECGKEYHGMKRSKYCSAECSGRVNNRTAHAREKAFPAIIKKESIGRYVVYTKHNNHCAICGIEANGTTGTATAPELDHIIPLCKGGHHTYSNIQLLCRSCNSAKGDNAPCEYTHTKPQTAAKKDSVKTITYTVEELIAYNNKINKDLERKAQGWIACSGLNTR